MDVVTATPICNGEYVSGFRVRFADVKLLFGDTVDVEYEIRIDPHDGKLDRFDVISHSIRRGMLQKDGSFK